MRRLLALASIALASGVTALAQSKPAVPLDPIAAIIDAFRTHDIVALGEGRHNNDQGYAFRLALIRDPRFAAAVNDIVVESGSAAHQDVMDRFIRGEPVPDKELRLAWQDTTNADGPWDVPMYEEFFRAVRTLNASLAPERKLRVLLGDPPFDWEHATREESIRISSRRDSFPAELIQREVLAKQRRALVVYGDMHFARRPLGSNIVTRLVDMKARVLNIWTHASTVDLQTLQNDIAGWPRPSLAMTAGTSLGAARFGFYRALGVGDEIRMEEQFDAVLYLGQPSSITVRRGEIDPALCADANYMKMRMSRLALMEPPGGATLPPGIVSPSERLKRYCESVTAR
ncbi:MAG TPA: hypothetical protein VH436_04605 [Vicinamibacterales bacterium]|jgi:hypothetical protein